MRGFQIIFEPLSESYRKALDDFARKRKPGGLQKRFLAGMLTIQVGLVMGYLSRNVLGQFDLGIPDPEAPGELYIVLPNMIKTEGRLGLDADDFRLWITLHEVTHAVEFRAHSWLRSHMKQLMEEYFQSVALRLEDVGSRFKRRSVSRDGDLKEIMKQGGVISLVSTPEQRLMLLRIQAFMSLIEGYSNLVMDGVGKEVIASYEQMSAAFKRRQETKTGAERLAQRMLGFDLKLRQYQVGELFCREVMEKEGLPYLNRVWEVPENLPTSEEIEQPFRWIDRMRTAGERVTHYSA